VLITGTAGGVGVTTVTALLFSVLARERAGAPRLHDHSGGELGLRLPDGDEAARIDEGLVLHDLGAVGPVEPVWRLADPGQLALLVTAATPLGCAAAAKLITTVASEHGAPALRRVVLVAVEVFGRHKIDPQLAALRAELGADAVITVPRDPSLATGGRIPLPRLRPQTRRAIDRLAAAIKARP